MSTLKPTPAHDVLQFMRHPLDALFAPQSVAVIGATEKADSVGRTILWNLISSPFGGTVFPVNPNRPNVLGIKAYPNIQAVPNPIDVAVIVTPAQTVPGVIGECVDAGVKGAIVISAGFKEIGAEGAKLEQEILKQAQRGQMRIIGPNCLGVMRPVTGFNATFAGTIARPGSVGFISQSGALLTAILDWSLKENVGFSAFVSLGSMLDVDWGDLIYYLGDDPHTKSIVIYMETVGDARSFLSAAREVALTKPIIVIKAGRSEAASLAAASHTGSLTGSDDVLDAAFRRAGVLRVNSIADIFYMAEVLAKQPRAQGPHLTILTNAGGPGVLATDSLIAGGGELARLSAETMSAFDKLLPAAWSHNNPIDILGDADPDRYAKAIQITAKDPASDGLLVVLTPQAMTDPTQTAEKIKTFARLDGKPILASWMGGSDVEPGATILRKANIPTFPYPDTAVRMFNYLWQYNNNLRGLYETPTFAYESTDSRAQARKLTAEVRGAGRTLLTEFESKQLLAAYGIPTVETFIATNEDDAVKRADDLGYPVVLKLYSETITHKTDVGGVRLDLANAEEVRRAWRAIQQAVSEKKGAEHFQGVTVQPMVKLSDAYELIIGASIDPQFGPVLLFGLGGQLVEVFQDHALALPPLNTTLARRMMEQTRIYRALKGVRGRAAIDLAALEELLVRFSQLVVEQRWIKEIDINPLLAAPPSLVGGPRASSGLIALDARIVLHDPAMKDEALPRLAIRPYPTRYVSGWTAKDGTPVVIRPIRPEDEPLVAKFHEQLSEQTVYMRYFHMMKLSTRVAHERLTRICFIDYDREMALVVEHTDDKTGEHRILAIGRLSKSRRANEAEWAVLVADPYQGKGLGTELLRRLIEIGREENLTRLTAEILQENIDMQRVAEKLGHKLKYDMDEGIVKAVLDL